MNKNLSADNPWRLAQADETAVQRLSSDMGLSPIVARILVGRGRTDIQDVRSFLEPDLGRDWRSVSEIPGMDQAAKRVARAVTDSESILVFGDFDLDGISAAAVAARGLKAMGANVQAIVPHRFREGYGLTTASIERIRSLGAQLVVTVDCGVSAGTEVELLKAIGIDVVITDHHEPGDAMPVGVPVADPKIDGGCRSGSLAGAGVALKLIQAVGVLLGQPDVWLDLTDLATLGTVADIVPLESENRALVTHGLQRMRSDPSLGIAALATVTGVDIGTVTADNIAFALAPRLNAAGRMADPAIALELLMTSDPIRAEELARSLDEHNSLRQSVEYDLFEAATALADREFEPGDRALVLAGEGWHEGVKGIVASRLVNRYGVPAFLFAVEDGVAKGSARSVGDVDLHAAISACSDLVIRFGGHAAAAGVTLDADRIDEFKRRILDHFSGLPAESFVVKRDIDAMVELQEVSLELASEIALLQPFGHGNPRPTFASNGVFMNGRQRVGKGSAHLKFSAYDGVTSVPAIAFRCRDIREMADRDAAVDLAYQVEADEWRGRRRIQLMVRDFHSRETSGYSPASELVNDLFEHADEILAREEYAGIQDAPSFHTKLAGVTFEGRQDVVAGLEPGAPLRLQRQPDNQYDANACGLHDSRGVQVGFLNRRLAAVLAPVMDAGVEYDVEVTEVTGGQDGQSLGVNVLVSRRDGGGDERDFEVLAVNRQALTGLPPEKLDAELTRRFIGEGQLHAAQVQALAHLAAGRNTLTVMATGRGKSLIFHLHAARTALLDNHASVFVFPLRALVADQAFHLEDTFAEFGVRVRTVTGETAQSARDDAFADLASGELDVILTTPEFLECHRGRFAQSGRVGFLVIDEAHHVGMARAGHRPAYAKMTEVMEQLGSPTVLAVTATADDPTTATIAQILRIEAFVTDPTVRENLILEDRRGCDDKDGYLAAVAARGEKMIVYVNSREQSVRIARMLRKRVPEVADKVAFYNGGLSKSARHAVERAFREGHISVIISTSAFGEGVNIPDVRHVALYHLPFNSVEFNQMCGRAGRDGAPSRVHPLFGKKDGRINDMILSSSAPEREDLGALYLVLRDLQDKEGSLFEITNAELADQVKARRPKTALNDKGVSTGLGVFRELGLVEGEGYGAYRRLAVPPRPEVKVDLNSSIRYTEGAREIEQFGEFRTWVLESESEDLLHRFNRPILPSHIPSPV
ncbi:MAG: single-stranded-DNA-specific exonuclease RecJ [Actinomycetota bacterium]|nr:single-stranded-DNA-specific exonuclease RecJ [Actinomycetota bacterium]